MLSIDNNWNEGLFNSNLTKTKLFLFSGMVPNMGITMPFGDNLLVADVPNTAEAIPLASQTDSISLHLWICQVNNIPLPMDQWTFHLLRYDFPQAYESLF